MELHVVAGSLLQVGGMEMHSLAFSIYYSIHPEIDMKSLLVSNKRRVLQRLPGLIELSENQFAIEGLKDNPEKDAASLLRNIRSRNAIVFLNAPKWLPMIRIAKSRMPGLRVVVRSGGNDLLAGWVAAPEKGIKNEQFVALINTCVDRLVVSSNFSLDRFEKMGVDPQRMIKVPGGVDCQAFQPIPKSPNGVFQIANVCRYLKMKGIEIAIRTIAELVNRGRFNIHFTVTGKSRTRYRMAEQIRLSQLASDLGISEFVTFAPQLPMVEIHSAYQAADLFLHTPIYHPQRNKFGEKFFRTETMGRSLCEASATGLPIVSSRVGGVPEIVQDELTGFLVDEGDYIAAADRVEHLMDNPTLSKTMGLAGRNYAVESLDWPILFTKYEEVFRELAD